MLSAVRGYISESLLDRNLLLVDVRKLSDEILERFPALSHVQIDRTWSRDVRVDIVERRALGVWCRPRSRDQECFLFDNDRVWGRGVPSTGTLMLTIMDHHPEGSPVAGLVADILKLTERMKVLDISTAQVVLPAGSLDEIHLLTTDGYPIYFSKQSDLDEQLEVLEIFLGQVRTNGDFLPAYIDVRVPGKIYYK